MRDTTGSTKGELQYRNVRAGARILPGGNTRELYIVISGAVDTFKYNYPRSVMWNGTVGPGESFGESEFFFGNGDDIFQAKEETLLFVVKESTFDWIARTQPYILYNLLRMAHKRLAEAAVKKPVALKPMPSAKAQASPAQSAAQPRKKTGQATPPSGAKPLRTATPTQPLPSNQKEGKVPLEPLFLEGHKSFPGVHHPEYRQFVYGKSFKCPCCGHTFQGDKVFTSRLVSAAPMRYDLRKYYEGFRTEWYDILTCPQCYFSMFSGHFLERKGIVPLRIQDALRASHAEVALEFEGERDLNFVFAAHYIALRCAHAYINAPLLRAKIWSNISWLYEDAQEEALMRKAASRAAEESARAYMECRLTATQEQMLCLAAAGMLYRAKEDHNIKKWIFNAKTHKEGKRVYADLADRLMDIIREEEQKKKALLEEEAEALLEPSTP